MSDNNQAQERITGQIAVHKTDKKLLEFIDNLHLAPIQDGRTVLESNQRLGERF